MTGSAISDREVAAFRRFILKLPHEADPTLVVLKAHLLIEEQLRLAVDERMVNQKR